MEVYDTANRLAEELKNSKQYKDLKEAKERLFADANKRQLIIDFEELKKEVQLMEVQKMQDKPVDEEAKKEKLAKMYKVLIENKDIKKYFDYEIAFNQLMVDVNKIIGNSIRDVL